MNIFIGSTAVYTKLVETKNGYNALAYIVEYGHSQIPGSQYLTFVEKATESGARTRKTSFGNIQEAYANNESILEKERNRKR